MHDGVHHIFVQYKYTIFPRKEAPSRLSLNDSLRRNYSNTPLVCLGKNGPQTTPKPLEVFPYGTWHPYPPIFRVLNPKMHPVPHISHGHTQQSITSPTFATGHIEILYGTHLKGVLCLLGWAYSFALFPIYLDIHG